MAPLCSHCDQKPATCQGRSEGERVNTPAYDDCCAHDQEDMHCVPLGTPDPTESRPRVYIATRLHRAAEARALAAVLESAGFAVVSSWHLQDRNARDEQALPRAARQGLAARNTEDLRSAEATVFLAVPYDPTYQGALVELGMAHGRGQRVVVVGDPEQHMLMVDLPEVLWVSRPEEVVQALGDLRREPPWTVARALAALRAPRVWTINTEGAS